MKSPSAAYRYLRIFNKNNWYCNISEVRFHGEVRQE